MAATHACSRSWQRFECLIVVRYRCRGRRLYWADLAAKTPNHRECSSSRAMPWRTGDGGREGHQGFSSQTSDEIDAGRATVSASSRDSRHASLALHEHLYTHLQRNVPPAVPGVS